MEPIDFRLKINSIIGGHMPNIINYSCLIFLTEEQRINNRDSYFQLNMVIDRFKKGNSTQRLLSKSLLFLKQHYGIIRHREDITEKDISKSLGCLSDLLVCISDLSELNIYNNLEEYFNLVNNFYKDYHQCIKEHFKVPNIEHIIFKGRKPTIKTENDMPQHQSIRWYKENGYSTILKEKIIIFEAGSYSGIPCKIITYNKPNTKCQFENGEHHFISVGVPLTWK